MLWMSPDLAKKHYGEHEGGLLQGFVEFIKSGPIVALVIEGDDAIAGIRKMVGPQTQRKQSGPSG